jgi:hypothetical protein
MTEDIQSHLKAIEAWLDHVDQTPLPAPAAKGLSPEEKQQLQTVNKAIEQLSRLGVEIPSDLRSLKLRLSANDVAAVSNPHIAKHLAVLESLIDGLEELSQAARVLRRKLKPERKEAGKVTQFGVTLKQLLDAGFLSPDDFLESQGPGGKYEAKVLSDGSVSFKTVQGWKTSETLGTACAELIGRREKNPWRRWWKINQDGTRTKLAKIRTDYLNQTSKS